jgi:hypothetical protein
VLLHPGLVLVDILDFRYSGFVLGVLLLAVYFTGTYRGPLPLGAAFFALFLNLDAGLALYGVGLAVALVALGTQDGNYLLGSVAAVGAVFAVTWLPFKVKKLSLTRFLPLFDCELHTGSSAVHPCGRQPVGRSSPSQGVLGPQLLDLVQFGELAGGVCSRPDDSQGAICE